MSEIPPDPFARELRTVRRLGRLLMVLLALLTFVVGLYLWPLVREYFTSASPREITPRGDLTDLEKMTTALFKRASPSVTFITTDTLRRIPYTRRMQEVPEGAGSGFVWSAQGYIVTNYHVIRNASAAHVILNDQSTYDAQIVGADPDHDLAVLKISPPMSLPLTPIPVGTSGDLQVGQSVLAIGNPFGLDQTLTTGIISALKRTITGVSGNPIEDAIQIDAAINPGNSGGPLLDSAGRLIGMNTAIYSASGVWSGIGFAIPVDTIKRIVPQIIANGKVSRAHIGFIYDEELSTRLLPGRNVEGLVVEGVAPNSPAQKAGISGYSQSGRGIQLGDVVTHLNGHPVKTGADVFSIMDHVTPGDNVKVTVWNNGATRDLNVTTSP